MSKFAPHRRGTNNPPATTNTVCQKCLGRGHYIYECKDTRPYVSRPSRTELLEKPSALAKHKKDGQPSIELPEEFKTKTGVANKILEERERQRKKSDLDSPPKKRRKRSSSPSDSISATTSSTGSQSDSDSESRSSDSESNSDSSVDSRRTSNSKSTLSRSRSRKRTRS